MNSRLSPAALGLITLAASMGLPVAEVNSWPAGNRRHEPTEGSKEIQTAAEAKRARKRARNLQLATNVQKGRTVA